MDHDKISRESYQEDTDIFGKLADHEDYQGNLCRYLKKLFEGKNNLVLLEAGAGLGRHTPDYLEYCRSVYLTDLNESMIKRCSEKYKNKANMKWFQLDHGSLGNIPVQEPVDVILGTYTFGHYICACDTTPECAYQDLLHEFYKISHTENTEIIIAEVGSINNNDCTADTRLGEFYALLTRDFGKPQSISTDYQFKNVGEAAYIMGNFFGKEAANDIFATYAESEGQVVSIPENTYLWHTKLSLLSNRKNISAFPLPGKA